MKPIQVWKIEFCDYIDVEAAAYDYMMELGFQYDTEEGSFEWEEAETSYYEFFKKELQQTKYVEGKTRAGAIGNLKNILYNVHLEIINAVPVM